MSLVVTLFLCDRPRPDLQHYHDCYQVKRLSLDAFNTVRYTVGIKNREELTISQVSRLVISHVWNDPSRSFRAVIKHISQNE